MAFPLNPVDSQLFTTTLGTEYRYDSTNHRWLIISQSVQGIQGVTGISLGDTGIQGVTGFLGETGIFGPAGVTGVIGTTGVSSKTGVLNFSMASNIGALYTGIMGQTVLPNNSYFTNWTVLSDTSSTLYIDFQKSDYSTYPVMTSGSTGILLNSALKNTGTYWGAPTGAQGAIVRAVLSSTDGTAARINLALNYNIY